MVTVGYGWGRDEASVGCQADRQWQLGYEAETGDSLLGTSAFPGGRRVLRSPDTQDARLAAWSTNSRVTEYLIQHLPPSL